MTWASAQPIGAATVFLIDDDEMVLRGLGRLVRSAGLAVETYGSARALLERGHHEGCGCVVLDLCMPGMNGLQVQQALQANGNDLPVLFLSGQGDVPSTVQAMKAGAVDFLVKPVQPAQFLSAIRAALEHHAGARDEHAQLAALRERYARLTAREREVCALVVAGLPNKVSAARLGVAEKTVKIHRGQVMRKLDVRTVPDLVRAVQRLDPPRAPPGAVQ